MRPKLDEFAANTDSRALSRGWQGVLGRLQLELNPHNYATWLKGTRALRMDGTSLVVEAKSAMTCEWLNQRLRVVVERAAAQSFPALTAVQFVPPGDTGNTPLNDAPTGPPTTSARATMSAEHSMDAVTESPSICSADASPTADKLASSLSARPVAIASAARAIFAA